MVSSQQEEVFRILDFVAEKQADGLDGLLFSVDIVSQEEIVSFGREDSILEDSQQIVVLSVYITYNNIKLWSNTTKCIEEMRALLTADLNWGFKLQQVGLADENVS